MVGVLMVALAAAHKAVDRRSQRCLTGQIIPHRLITAGVGVGRLTHPAGCLNLAAAVGAARVVNQRLMCWALRVLAERPIYALA